MAELLTEKLQAAMQKAGIDIHFWTEEQAAQALGFLSSGQNKQAGARFDRQLLAQLNGQLPDGHIYQMGLPCPKWLQSGVPNVPVEMQSVKLQPLLDTLESPKNRKQLLGLTESLAHPVAIFHHDERSSQQSLLMAFYHQEKPMMLNLNINRKDGQQPQVEIDHILPVHQGEEYIWLFLAQQKNKCIYLDKERMQQLIERFRKERPDDRTVRYPDLADFVRHFQNPQFQKQIQVAASGFYSNAEFAVNRIAQEKATPVQWLAMIQKNGGIKAGEDKWLGLSDWLRSSSEKTLAKAQVLEYIQQHKLCLKEDVYQSVETLPAFVKMQNEFKRLAAEFGGKDGGFQGDDAYQQAFDELVERYDTEFEDSFGWEDTELYVKDDWQAGIFFDVNAISETRMHHTTKGLDDYHEIAFYFNDIESWNADDEIHFGEVGDGRCVAWVRFGEKNVKRLPTIQEKWDLRKTWPGPEGWVCRQNPGTDKYIYTTGQWDFSHDKAMITETARGFSLSNMITGQGGMYETLEEAVDEYISQQVNKKISYKILVIDEIQSNRHQDGREKGYRDEKQFHEANEEYRLSQEMVKNFTKAMEKKYEKEWWSGLNVNDLNEEEQNEYRFLNSQATAKLNSSLTLEALPPVAPLEKNWHEVCMKRMLRYAAENGFDRLAWITGEKQAERYEMGTYIAALKSWPIRKDVSYDSLEKDRIEGYEVVISTSRNGDMRIKTDKEGFIYWSGMLKFQDKRLADVIGKGLAAKILESDKKINLSSSEVNYLMEIGGMRTFYNEMLPQFMNRYGKQWGVQVKLMDIPTIGQMYGIDVTASMKESVMQGQPLFMFGKEGQVLGLSLGDSIYLTPDGVNPETMVHEYTHVWATAMQYGNADAWNSIRQLLKESPVWGEICRNPFYADIRHDENALASEVLAQISGKAGADRLEAMQVSHPKDTLISLRKVLEKFWTWVGKHLFDLKEFNSIEEVTDRVLYDLVNSTALETGKPMAVGKDSGRLSHITVFHGKGGQLHIRCKIDGVQQMGKPLNRMDSLIALHPEILKSLAHTYFCKELELSSKQQNSIHR